MNDTRPEVGYIETNDEPHFLCLKCTSSLHRDEPCGHCGGDGYDFAEDIGGNGDLEDEEIIQCPDCLAKPDGYHCSTCGAHWDFWELWEDGAVEPKETLKQVTLANPRACK